MDNVCGIYHLVITRLGLREMLFILIGSDLSIVNYSYLTFVYMTQWHSGYCFAVATKIKKIVDEIYAIPYFSLPSFCFVLLTPKLNHNVFGFSSGHIKIHMHHINI